MVRKSIEQRVAALESQIAEIMRLFADGNGNRNWRRTIGVFTGDDDMLQILRDAMKLREADRKAARKKNPNATK
jgi:hypothetical protein